jgi:hypothetical protein
MLGKACADAEFEHRPITGLTRPIAAMSNSTPSARVSLQTWCARRFLATVRLTAGPSSGVISKDAKMARWIAEQFGCRAKAMTHKIGGTSGEEPELKEPERSRPIPLRRQPTEKSFCGAAGLGSPQTSGAAFHSAAPETPKIFPTLVDSSPSSLPLQPAWGEASHSSMSPLIRRAFRVPCTKACFAESSRRRPQPPHFRQI